MSDIAVLNKLSQSLTHMVGIKVAKTVYHQLSITVRNHKRPCQQDLNICSKESHLIVCFKF